MGLGVDVSGSFKLVLAVTLSLTALPKLLLGTGFSNPSSDEIVKAVGYVFERDGYNVTSPVQFAGKEALLAMKGGCIIYAVPVAHQGWHQATIRQSLAPTQSLWFEFQGRLTRDFQETIYPLSVYYIRKTLRYVGFDTKYPPVLALIADGSCSISELGWDRGPEIRFKDNRILF